MSNKCIYQARANKETAHCLIPTKLQRSTLKITGWKCEYIENEELCPIVVKYKEYAEDYHLECCTDCDHEDMEDSIRQCGEDAHN